MTQADEFISRHPVSDPLRDDDAGGYIVPLRAGTATLADFYRAVFPPETDVEGLEVVVAAAADDQPEENTGGMIALVPSAADASRFVLAGGLPLEELHLTLQYLGNASELSDAMKNEITTEIEDWSITASPIVGNVFAVNFFNPLGDEPCVVLGIGGDDLEDVHDVARGVAEDADVNIDESHQPWIPHITLAYVEGRVTGVNVDELAQGRMGPVVFDRIRVAFGNEVYDYPLEGSDTAS